MRRTFEALAQGRAQNQPRRRLILETGSVLHSMAGAFHNYFGTKFYSTNPRYGAHFLLHAVRRQDRAAPGVDGSQSLGPDPNRRRQRIRDRPARAPEGRNPGHHRVRFSGAHPIGSDPRGASHQARFASGAAARRSGASLPRSVRRDRSRFSRRGRPRRANRRHGYQCQGSRPRRRLDRSPEP